MEMEHMMSVVYKIHKEMKRNNAMSKQNDDVQ